MPQRVNKFSQICFFNVECGFDMKSVNAIELNGFLLDSVVTLLPTNKEVSGSVPSSALGILSIGTLFNCIYGVGVSVFVCVLCSCSVLHSSDHSSMEALQLSS